MTFAVFLLDYCFYALALGMPALAFVLMIITAFLESERLS